MSHSWKAYAGVDHFGRDVNLHIYADHADGQHYDSVSTLSTVGATVNTLVRTEQAVEPTGAIKVPLGMAEAAYKALDRVFGQHHDQDTLQASLKKEQERVDLVMARLLMERVR